MAFSRGPCCDPAGANMTEPKWADLSVSIGFPCGASVPWQTALSLTRTVKACVQRGVLIDICVIAGSSVVTQARSVVVDSFLRGPSSRLFWVDSDMQWEAADFLKLLALSMEFDVVCGTYPMKNEKRTIAVKRPDPENYEINKYGLIKINGAGLG